MSALSSCLISVMRFVPISIAGLCRFLCGVSLVCLPVGSAAVERCSHLVVWMRCDVLLAHLSVSSLAPFCDTMGGEAGGCGLLIVFRSDFFAACLVPCSCLPRGVPLSRPMMWMAAGGWRSVGSVCCLLAYPVVSVPFRLSSLCRFIPWLIRLVRLGSFALMQWRGFGFVGCHALPCVLSSSPITCCVSSLKRRGRR